MLKPVGFLLNSTLCFMRKENCPEVKFKVVYLFSFKVLWNVNYHHGDSVTNFRVFDYRILIKVKALV